MKIIVTGGAGFIGSHIVDAYVENGHRVVVIDNLSTGFKKNINPRARFYKADIRRPDAVEKIFKREKPTVVNHHAALVAVAESVHNPLPTFETNVLGTANLLTAFGKYGRGKNKKFIFSSSGGAIYGNPKKIPAAETTASLPLSPYGLSKLLGEEIIKFYSRQFGFRYLIFRYANVYGPRQNPQGGGGVVAIFGWLMKSGRVPVIFGDGAKTRDYIYVEDIAKANISALHKGKDEILNLGSGKEISDQKIFDMVARQTGCRQKPRYAPSRKGEVHRVALNTRRAQKVLGWRPSTTLEQGIQKTLAQMQTR